MPRSVQAFRQNAKVTNSPANVTNGDPTDAIDAGDSTFALPPRLDVCTPVTSDNRNPFVGGLNTMGNATGNSTGVAGQTGNVLSGLQIFSDTLCGYALGNNTTGEVIAAWRHIREQGDDPREVYRAVRKLRDTVGAGTTPQSVLAGVEAVNGVVASTPTAQSAITKGQQAVGVSGNQVIDAVNGSQAMANSGSLLLTGQTTTTADGNTLLSASGQAINQNTANHAANQGLSTAQSVSLKQQNLLVSQDFHAAYSVVGDTQWGWDGSDGSPSTNALGCAKCVCNGYQKPLVSSEIPVVAGETIEVSAMVKWSGLTYTGASPIVLGVEKYRLMKDPHGSGQNVFSDIGWFDVYTVPSPGASSTGLAGTTNGWLGIAGTYTVEPGVDQLRFRLKVASNATAGTVRWDDAEFLKLDLIPAEAVPGLTDNIVTQLYGSAGAGFKANDAAEALANTRASLTSVSSEIAALQAEGHTGAVAGDDFSYTGAITTPNWTVTYSDLAATGLPNGSYAANGNDAVFTPRVGFQQKCMFVWAGTDAVSTTDYQIIQLVLDSSLQSSGANKSFISLRGRMNGTATTYIDAFFGSGGTYGIGYWISGTFTSLKTGTCAVPGAGTTLSLYCGDKTNTLPLRFIIKVGSVTLDTVDDTSSATAIGASNRGWGWGAESDASFNSSAIPPSINQWLALDQ